MRVLSVLRSSLHMLFMLVTVIPYAVAVVTVFARS